MEVLVVNGQLQFYASKQDDFDQLVSMLSCLTDRGFALIEGHYPPVWVYKVAKGVLVRFAVPGINPQRLKFVFQDHRIEISGTRDLLLRDRVRRDLRLERYKGKFKRTLELPFVIDQEHIVASYRNGELSMQLQESKKCHEGALSSTLYIDSSGNQLAKSIAVVKQVDGVENQSGRTRLPYCDIYEDRDAYIIFADLPSVPARDIDIAYGGGALILSSGRPRGEAVEESNLVYGESDRCCFKRTFRLTGEIDVDNLKATYQSGVLKVELAKQTAEKNVELRIVGG